MKVDCDAFGVEIEPDEDDVNPFRYCGEYYDTETGTYYLRARSYDPAIGRFTAEDPIRDGLNWYSYCGGNPVMFVDPTGLIPTKEEAAAMAEHIYGDYDMSEKGLASRTISGWVLIHVYRGRESMKMGIYIRENDDPQSPLEYAVVFKGSIIKFNLETLTIWKNNVEQFL